MLTVVDDCTRECPAIEVDTSLGGLRVRRVLDRIASERGLPEAIVLDNGPEFRGRALTAWSEERGVRLEFIQPGKPVQNAYAESFNGRLRDECLNANWFTSLSDARRKIETWRQDYNEQRPHSSLKYLPPVEFCQNTSGDAGMSGRFIQRWSEAGAQTPPLLRASSPLKPKNQLRTNVETGTANGGTSSGCCRNSKALRVAACCCARLLLAILEFWRTRRKAVV